MLNELLGCPFCGKTETLEIITGQQLMDEDQEFWPHSDSYAVICNAAKPHGKGGCGGTGGFADSEDKAIAQWNRRANASGKPTTEAAKPL